MILIFFLFLSSPSSGQDGGGGFNTLNAIKIALHKENYIYPMYHTNTRPLDARDSEEAKYQFSIKISLVGDGHQSLSFAYTQKSFWQVYDQSNSRPFREHNYNPEFFARLGGATLFIDLGYEHESNGQEDPKSRSWDRLYYKVHFRRSGYKFYLKHWMVIANEHEGPSQEERTSTMKTYYGNGEVGLGFKMGSMILKGYGRLNFDSNKGFLESKILFPLGRFIYFSVVYTKGYGDSLRTYNYNHETFGFGLLMNP